MAARDCNARADPSHVILNNSSRRTSLSPGCHLLFAQSGRECKPDTLPRHQRRNVMKKRLSIALALVVLLAFPLFSAELQMSDTITAISAPDGAPLTVGEATTRLRNRVHSSVISVETSNDNFIIPIAGNAAGGNG